MKSEVIHVRISTELKKKLEETAKKELRAISAMAAIILKRGLK